MKQWKVINHFLSKVFCFLCQWQYTLELTCFCEVKRKGRGNWRNLWQCRASEQLYLHSVLMQERPGMYWVLRKIGYFKFALMRVIHCLPPAARFLISNKAKFISKHLFYWHSRIDGLWSFCLTKEIRGTYLEYINGNWCLIWFVILNERMVIRVFLQLLAATFPESYSCYNFYKYHKFTLDQLFVFPKVSRAWLQLMKCSNMSFSLGYFIALIFSSMKAGWWRC